MNAIMKVSGVQGGSHRRPGWIDLISVGFGTQAGPKSVSVEKEFDRASPKLAQSFVQGTSHVVEIRVFRGNDELEVSVHFEGARIVSYSIRDDGNDRVECISWNAEKTSYEYPGKQASIEELGPAE